MSGPRFDSAEVRLLPPVLAALRGRQHDGEEVLPPPVVLLPPVVARLRVPPWTGEEMLPSSVAPSDGRSEADERKEDDCQVCSSTEEVPPLAAALAPALALALAPSDGTEEDDCPVCYVPPTSSGPRAAVTCKVCKHAVCGECEAMMYQMTHVGHARCPMCRAPRPRRPTVPLQVLSA